MSTFSVACCYPPGASADRWVGVLISEHTPAVASRFKPQKLAHMQTTKHGPARPQRPLAAFIYDQSTTLPDGHAGRLRASLEAHIDRCIAMLDSIDPDPDLEDTGDFEPWLAGDPTNDAGHDLEDDPCDDEPALGWPDGAVDQSQQLKPETLWSIDCEADEFHGSAAMR